MHIIKHGVKKITRYEKPLIFSCLSCNCRFEANPDEYTPPDDDNYRDGATAKCPECGEISYEEFTLNRG